jgi:5'-methylthioadenosine phosphorylase
MLAIIGGTGIYQFEGLQVTTTHTLDTPYGAPSSPIIEGKFGELSLLFLARHGQAHSLLPHEVNYRANIWALKQLGATEIIGLSAVGSLQQEIAPGELSLVSQYFDFIKGNREKTFFGEGLAAHVSTAEPSCSSLATDLLSVANANGIELHTDKTYGCVDGPRLGTRAESLFLQGIGCDLVGMTNVPEVFLAREAQICYLTIAIATDYDCWLDDPEQHVTVEQVISRYGTSLEKAKTLLRAYLQSLQEAAVVDDQCGCRSALACAVLTPIEAIPASKRELLAVLQR